MFTIDKNHPLLDVTKTAPILSLYSFKKEDASKRNIDFQLNLFDFVNVLQNNTCCYTGTKLLKDSIDTAHKPSFERINPFEGYTPTNTVLVTVDVNRCKNKLDLFLRDDAMTIEQKIKVMNKVIYRLKKQLNKERAV